MPCKLNVAVVATRWQWEAMGLGYSSWPPDGAGIQQITNTLALLGAFAREPKGSWKWPVQQFILQRREMRPREGVGRGLLLSNEGWSPGFLTLSLGWLFSLYSNDALVFFLDLCWRQKCPDFLFIDLPNFKSLKNVHKYHLSLWLCSTVIKNMISESDLYLYSRLLSVKLG